MKIFRISKQDHLALLVITLLPIIAALHTLLGWLHADPALYLGGMSLHLEMGPLAGSPYIDPNNAFTTQALGIRAALDWLHGTVPWWNPYSGVGLPLAGEYQPAVFFPLTLLLALPNGILIEHITLQILSGWGGYVLLRQLGIIRAAALAGALMYAFNGTLAWFDHAPALPVPLLPWMLLGIERAFVKTSIDVAGGWRLFAVALGLNLLAGFPETAYLQGLMVFAWAAVRFFQLPILNRRQYAWRIILGGLVGLGMAAPQILAFFDFLPHSWLGGHNGQFAHGSLVRPALVPSLFAPYAYGNVFSHLDAWQMLLFIWGNVGGYVTILMLGLAVYGFLVRRDAIAWLLLGCIVLTLAKTFGVEPVVSLVNCIPGIPETAFYRYAVPVWELSVIILAVFGLHSLLNGEVHMAGRRFTAIIIVLAMVGVSAYMFSLLSHYELGRGFRDSVLASVVWMIVTSGVLILALFLTSRHSVRSLAIVLVMDSVLMFVVPTLSNPKHGQLDLAAISYLQRNLGFQRFYTLGPIQPNYGAQFGIASINHNYLPIDQHWVEWIKANLDRGVDPVSFTGGGGAGGAQPAQSLRLNLANYEWVGVKYVVTPAGFDPFIDSISSSVSADGNKPVVLMPGDVVSGLLPTSAVLKDATVNAVGVMQGNYGNTATGLLSVMICSPDECAKGSADLTTSLDNTSLLIQLERPISLRRGQAVKYMFKHVGGHTPIAVWEYPIGGDGAEQHMIVPGGAEHVGMGLLLDLRIVSPDFSPPARVYRDTVMDIYALPNVQPYFQVISGDCIIHPYHSRARVEVDCAGPATLLRREMHFPGWVASINGHEKQPAIYKDLFQSVGLSAGHSVVEFSYSPPHILWAWIAMWLSLVALVYPSLLRHLRRFFL